MNAHDSSDDFNVPDERRITCQEFVERVTSYLEGDLSEEQRRHFEGHAHYCSGCGTYLQQMLLTIQAIQETPPEDIFRAEAAVREDSATSTVTPESDDDEPGSLDELLRAFRSSKPPPDGDRD